MSGQEYSIDGGKTWQTSGTFTGLTPETEYSIVTKITATSTANESPVSDALKVTTDKNADSSTPTPTDKPTETPGSTTAPTDTPSTTTTPGATTAPTDKVTKAEKAKAKLSLNAGLKVSCVGKKVTVKWGKVSKADRYVVYAAYCGPDKCKNCGSNSAMEIMSCLFLFQYNNDDAGVKSPFALFMMLTHFIEFKQNIYCNPRSVHTNLPIEFRGHDSVKGICLHAKKNSIPCKYINRSGEIRMKVSWEGSCKSLSFKNEKERNIEKHQRKMKS